MAVCRNKEKSRHLSAKKRRSHELNCTLSLERFVNRPYNSLKHLRFPNKCNASILRGPSDQRKDFRQTLIAFFSQKKKRRKKYYPNIYFSFVILKKEREREKKNEIKTEEYSQAAVPPPHLPPPGIFLPAAPKR